MAYRHLASCALAGFRFAARCAGGLKPLFVYLLWLRLRARSVPAWAPPPRPSAYASALLDLASDIPARPLRPVLTTRPDTPSPRPAASMPDLVHSLSLLRSRARVAALSSLLFRTRAEEGDETTSACSRLVLGVVLAGRSCCCTHTKRGPCGCAAEHRLKPRSLANFQPAKVVKPRHNHTHERTVGLSLDRTAAAHDLGGGGHGGGLSTAEPQAPERGEAEHRPAAPRRSKDQEVRARRPLPAVRLDRPGRRQTPRSTSVTPQRA